MLYILQNVKIVYRPFVSGVIDAVVGGHLQVEFAGVV
jgi:hypothetical protein